MTSLEVSINWLIGPNETRGEDFRVYKLPLYLAKMYSDYQTPLDRNHLLVAGNLLPGRDVLVGNTS